MEAWMIWFAVGIICVIIEIFTPGFLFMSFGIGAMLTGLFALLVDNLPWQIFFFACATLILFIFLRKLSNKVLSRESEMTNFQALVGKKGTVVEAIPEDGKGYVRIDSEEWSAVSEAESSLAVGQKIVVEKVEGNKVIVKESEKGE